MKRKICVITGSRAEYGILRPLLDEIKKDAAIRLQLIATGMHLSREFGLTYRDIERDGFRIDKKIGILQDSDTPPSILKSMGLAMSGFAEAYERLRPDIIVVLGDRFEIFSMVSAAHVIGVPVAHISGGELTEGSMDNAFRHSITKMSHLHFTSTETYRKRVIQLGENPKVVFNVGALNIDSIKRSKLLTKKQLEKGLNFRFKERNLLVTFHPATLGHDSSVLQFKCLLEVLGEMKNTGVIFTKANADPGGRAINSLIDNYVSARPFRSVAFASMGQLKYISTMQFVDAVVGNSSSGIVEAPSFGIGTINIGDRQEGRIKAESIIDCGPKKAAIKSSIKKLYSREFQGLLKTIKSLYGKGGAAIKIKNILKNHGLKGILRKKFYNIRQI